MEITAQCVPCLLNRALYEVRQCRGDRSPQDELDILREAARKLGHDAVPGACSAVVATGMHGYIYKALGERDPYARVKHLSNETALKVLPRARVLVEGQGPPGSDERIRAALLAGIIGNLMDFGIKGGMSEPQDLDRAFEGLFREGLGVDHTTELLGDLDLLGKAILLTDNCGEIVFDTLLVRELVNRGTEVHVMVKKEPVLTDATREDIEISGMGELVTSVLDNNGFFVGLSLEALTPETRTLMAGSVILSKGMANFEALSEPRFVEIGPLYYLMRTKCSPVAVASHSPLNVNAVVSEVSMDRP